jgi:hypothetical protein
MRNYLTWKCTFFRWITCFLLVSGTFLVGACGGDLTLPTTSGSGTPSVSSTPLPVTTYHVSGAQILDNHGRVFIPYGVQLMGLFTLNWHQSLGSDHLDLIQMKSARNIWHANTVGIQLSAEDLFVGTSYSRAYLAKVDQEVTWAREEGMNTLLILQYEGEGITPPPLPTEGSVQFWNFMSVHYRNDPWVFFDLFNEPVHPPGLTEAETWPIWQHGGDGYIGMQELVNTIRGNGAQNLIFIDGLAAGEDLQGVPTHRVNGDNIVYAVHPYFGSQHQSKQQWNTWFGDVAATANFPVVADEWNEYQSTSAECVLQAPTLAPQFLDYLNTLHIGLIAWALFPGLLIRGWNYADPTAFDQQTYECNAPFPNYSSQAQGAGQLLLHYFATHASSG